MKLNKREQEQLIEAEKQYNEVHRDNFLIGVSCFVIAFLLLIFIMSCIGGVFMLPLTILLHMWKAVLWLIQI